MRDKICLWILEKMSWQVQGVDILDQHAQCVIIVAPHTSNIDFIIGMLVRTAYNLQRYKFLGKASLFRWPLGYLFRWLGGYPVERSHRNNLVQDTAQLLISNPNLSIVIAPEGTRKKVAHFKTGFYYIAKTSQIPIIPCIFNFEKKLVHFTPAFITTEDSKKDIELLENLYRGIPGKIPSYSF